MSICGALGGQQVDERCAGEPATESTPVSRRPHGYMVSVPPEGDLVAGFDAEFVSQGLGNHDLPLGADTMSHTTKYNQWLSGAYPRSPDASSTSSR